MTAAASHNSTARARDMTTIASHNATATVRDMIAAPRTPLRYRTATP